MSEKDIRIIFANNLNYFLNLNQENQIDVANKLGISPSTFSSWCTGQKMPRMDKVEMLASYFKIKKSDLLESDVSESESVKAFFRLKKGLEPYNIDNSDADFILSVFKAHKEKN